MNKKRIVAGLTALLMVFGAGPLPQLAEIMPSGFVISASAAAYVVTTSDDMVEAKLDTKTMTITIMPTAAYYDDVRLAKEIHFDFSGYKAEIFALLEEAMVGKKDAVAPEECKIALGAPSDYPTFFASQCVNLAQVYFEDGFIEEIGPAMFRGCTNLQFAVFGDNITSIGANAFNGCKNFVGSNRDNTLQLNNVNAIGDNAFKDCAMIEHINFDGSIVDIGKYAFANCKALKDLDFPNTLSKIDNNAFNGCTQLETMQFADDTAIELIGLTAFSKDTMLKTVNFGTGTTLRHICSGAFSSDTMLQEVIVNGVQNTLPNGIEYMGKGVFSGDTALQSFIIPNDLQALSPATFNKCTALKDVRFGDEHGNDSVCEIIGDECFYGCTALNKVNIPNSVLRICYNAFNSCSSLEKVAMSDNILTLDGKVEVSDTEFIYSYVSTPDDNTPDPLDYKFGGTFANCPELAIYPRADMADAEENWLDYANKVKLPDSLERVPESCFMNDKGITDIYLADVNSVGYSAMENCTSLTFVHFPEKVVYLNYRVLKGCTSLKDIEVSPRLGAIIDEACMNCTALETMTPFDIDKYDYTIQFPATCGGVQKSAFENCNSFRYLNILKDDSGYTNFGTVGEKAFKGCEAIEGTNIDNVKNDTLTLPENLVVVQASAFENCKNLPHIVLTGDVSTIAEKAFMGCASLKSIEVSDTVKQVGAMAFKDCITLENMPMTDTGATALSNLQVINNSVFENCTALTSAFIPANVTLIDSKAFKDCAELANVQWEEGSKLEQIGEQAFSSCQKLTAFSPEAEGEKTSFPDSLVTIKKNAFEKCALKDLTIGSPANAGKVMIIEDGAFNNDHELVNVDMSSSNLTSIEKNLFMNCDNLRKVTLPDTAVKSIGAKAFSDCHYLHTFGTAADPEGEYVIPETLISIGGQAFDNNYCMQKISFPATASVIDLSMFNINIKFDEIESKGYTPIEYIEVSEDNKNYSSMDGVLYNKDKTTLLEYPIMAPYEYFTIPDSVKAIGNYAMAATCLLKGVTLNEGLESIGNNAMYTGNALEYVDFGDNDTVTIGTNAFTATGTATKNVLLYGTAPCTAKDYAGLPANSRNVTFVDAVAEVDILDENGESFESKRISTAEKSIQLSAAQLNAKGEPAEDKLVWSSSDPEVAEVNETGNLTVKNEGTAEITVTDSRGLVSDTVEVEVFEKLTAELSEKEFTYDGTAKEPRVTVKSGSKVLKNGRDYTVEYSDNVQPGSGKVMITGSEDYPETLEATFKITGADITNCDVRLDTAEFTYDGTAKKPAVTAKNGSITLKEGTDYTVKYSNNVNAGDKAVVTIQGKGSYKGTVTKNFTIKQAAIKKADVTVADSGLVYNGSAQTPKVTVKNAAASNYDIEYKNNVNAGSNASVTVTGKGNYTGTVQVTFTIEQADISKMTAKLSEDEFVYDGTAKEPEATVKGLTDGKDYEVSYTDNTEVGTAKAVIKGIGNYKGEITKEFDITARSAEELDIELDIAEAEYTGEEITPAVTVKDGDKVLTEGVDYTVEYSDNVQAGTATVTITGMGAYEGTAEAEFIIKAKDEPQGGDDQPGDDEPAQPGDDQPGDDQPGDDQPDQPGDDQPDQPGDDQPGDDEPGDDDATDGEDEVILRGDINKDGDINVTDVAMLAAHVKSIRSVPEGSLEQADVNGDGDINVTDLAKLAAHVKGIRPIDQ
ncbi:leucine-rich repeat protein [Ruminococcus sp.]|uniref:leucine-rich repeat protein n=1 Tax=Ruminococcus sp. TaxID=41978 RepID=UPI0025CD3F2D|nr:leucine-rich repeat protein [Ruminococcus sp.]MBQ8967808.1 leucine-rich repeat protein [Ruminococcus sp.]